MVSDIIFFTVEIYIIKRDPRGPVEVHKMMTHTKYQSCMPCGFRQEELKVFIAIIYFSSFYQVMQQNGTI